MPVMLVGSPARAARPKSWATMMALSAGTIWLPIIANA